MKAWRALLASLLTAGLLLSPPARAKPASWHLWQSMLTGKRICAQTSPGKGWTRLGGPFRDAGCRQATTGSPAGSNSSYFPQLPPVKLRQTQCWRGFD